MFRSAIVVNLSLLVSALSVAGLSVAIAGQVSTSEQVSQPLELTLATPEDGPRILASILPDSEYSGPWPEDHFILRVYSGADPSSALAEYRFASTYMRVEVLLADLDNDEVKEVLLIRGEGRGTNVRTESLEVHHWNGASLEMMISVPVSGFFGAGRWWYEPSVVDVNRDGVEDLRLVRHSDPIDASQLNDPTLIPDDAVLEYVFDQETGHVRRRGPGE